ncbi:MAG TPA: hypothetical protein VF614_04820 [Chthoniobacteraceae bacterium]|jgi:hypothetical protein
MNDFTSLVDRGVAWIEGKTPKLIRINGGPLTLSTVDFIGKKDAFGNDTRQREVNVDATIVIRRVHITTAPEIGAEVLIDARTLRVFEVREDETSITLLVDSAQK